MSIPLILFAIIFVVVAFTIYVYNSLVTWKNRVKESWSDIEVQLKRRLDLIPNLIETVKGYASHEKEIFEKVSEARAQMLSAKTPKDYAKTDNMLEGTLKTLFAVAENYPDLKANVNFLELQRELADTENKIQAARRFYNSAVMTYNTKLQVFPNNIVARLFNFQEEEFFELEESEKDKASQPVAVNFNNGKGQ